MIFSLALFPWDLRMLIALTGYLASPLELVVFTRNKASTANLEKNSLSLIGILDKGREKHERKRRKGR